VQPPTPSARPPRAVLEPEYSLSDMHLCPHDKAVTGRTPCKPSIHAAVEYSTRMNIGLARG